MKTRILITLGLIVALAGSTFAQKGEKGADRKAQKIAFITERLALTPEESKVFWPVYEAKKEAKKKMMKALKGDRKTNPRKKIEEMSDEEVKEMLENSLKIKQGSLDIDKEYNAKFLAILPPKKVAKLYHVEREFNKHRKKEHKEAPATK
jgi:hypothetical protein